MKKLVKIFVVFLMFLIIIFASTRLVSILYPITIIDIDVEDVTENSKDYVLHNLSNSILEIDNDLDSYIIIKYDIHIKNNTSKEIFIEQYKYIPPHKTVYTEDYVEFYDNYELKPGEEEHYKGLCVFDLKSAKRDAFFEELENKSTTHLGYWVFFNKIPVFGRA
ncbi:MAG: hypothetical protein ACI3XA_02925 [Clostridia bacterium]